ncbi:MAG TPA: JDVT-CTERM system glutamic-type intramembrane protease [bacterium]|nr:JDVT-CTERM system glutamic-type intramembrane protease [bacterium]
MGARSRSWLELLIVAGAGAFALLMLRHPASGRFAAIQFWIVPLVFLYAPVLAAWAGDKDFAAVGLALPEWSKAALDLGLFAAVVLPVFLVSWWALFHYGFGTSFHPRAPEGPATLVLWQLLGVSLPEEVFFRGYLQGRLNRLLGRSWKFPGSLIGPGLFITAAAFALAHYLTRPDPARLLVFFPGLLFGYLRERSGSVAAPVAAHALANAAFLTLQSWAA